MKLNLIHQFAVVLIIALTYQMTAKETPPGNETVDLNEYLGQRLYKVFTDIGVPDDVVCTADERNAVIMDYGVFGIQIENKIVTVIYFWENFTGEVFGNKIGLTRKEIESKYGKPDNEKNSSVDGSLVWIYNMKDTDRFFVLIFDEDAKIKRIQIELMP